MSRKTDPDLSEDELYQQMEVLEPYTAGELASVFEAPKQRVRNLLDRLAASGKIRKKEPEPKRTIWIREPPVHECPECDYRYEIKFLHPVLGSVQFCPRCGTQL